MTKLARCLRRDWKSSNCWLSFCAKYLIGGIVGSSVRWRKQLTAQNIGEMIWNRRMKLIWTVSDSGLFWLVGQSLGSGLPCCLWAEGRLIGLVGESVV